MAKSLNVLTNLNESKEILWTLKNWKIARHKIINEYAHDTEVILSIQMSIKNILRA